MSKTKEAKYHVIESTFNGKPTIGIWRDKDDKYPVVSFGIKKAATILDVIPEIRAFVQKHVSEE